MFGRRRVRGKGTIKEREDRETERVREGKMEREQEKERLIVKRHRDEREPV